MKFHQSAREMQQVKDYCNQLCREYGLSVTESKADPFRIPTWKRRLTDHIKEAMEQSRTQQEFAANETMLLFELESGNAALCAGGNARLRCTANGQCALFTVRLVGEAIPDSDNRNG